jgi:hypothetical protein
MVGTYLWFRESVGDPMKTIWVRKRRNNHEEEAFLVNHIQYFNVDGP